MCKTIESLFDREIISSKRQFLSGYQFTLGPLTPRVTIRLYKNLENGRVEFEQSHYIHTSSNPAGPYIAAAKWGEDEYDAMWRALNTLTMNYEAAIRSEEEPNDSWLVPNPDWVS